MDVSSSSAFQQQLVFNEYLLQFIWQFQYFNRSSLRTSKGELLQIVFPGTLNTNQGPDFSNAKIRIGDTLLAGSVELHMSTSDWLKHRHQSDARYRAVVLHVVYRHDMEVNEIPVLELEPHIPRLLLEKYQQFMRSTTFIPCSHSIAEVPDLVWTAWKERLVVERLIRKSEVVLQLIEESKNHWEEVFWWLLAKNFGVKANADVFFDIARSIPVNLLAKYKQQLIQIEALLFGQANLLNGQFNDKYPQLLQREYQFLSKKHTLKPVPTPVLFHRMRPGNFPTLRLAQLASLIHSSVHLFSKILELENVKQVEQLFEVMPNDFWHYHYSFDTESVYKAKPIGSMMIQNIIINTVVPTLFAYGIYHKQQEIKDKAVLWLQQIRPEENSITKGFYQLSISSKTAFDSQALVELKNQYCSEKKCLSCSVGNSLLKSTRR